MVIITLPFGLICITIVMVMIIIHLLTIIGIAILVLIVTCTIIVLEWIIHRIISFRFNSLMMVLLCRFFVKMV